MRKTLLLTAAAVMLGGLSLTAPASAAVSGPTQGAQASSTVEHVRMTRRERMMMRHRKMRHHRMMRSRMRSNDNAANPSRPGYQQNKGMTTGGPRY